MSLQTLHVAPGRAKETLRTLAALRGERSILSGRRNRARSCTKCATARGLVSTTSRIHPTTGPSTPHRSLSCYSPKRSVGLAMSRSFVSSCRTCKEHWSGSSSGATAIDDGLVEYTTHSPDGVRIVHQGWKDSHDSLHDADGRSVTGSIALVEVQGYVYAAYRWLADVVAQKGDAPWATELRDRSDQVRRVVEDRFWLPEEGYYAQALDEQKRPVAAISSNPGHLLYCELPSPERGRLVAARLRQSDLDSGWGVRTLATSMADLQPDELPQRLGLAARQQSHRRRFGPVRRDRRAGADRFRAIHRGRSFFPNSACRSSTAGSRATRTWPRTVPSSTRSVAVLKHGAPARRHC